MQVVSCEPWRYRTSFLVMFVGQVLLEAYHGVVQYNLCQLPFDSLPAALYYFNNSNSSGGLTCFIALLWTLWLVRNDCVFHKRYTPYRIIDELFKNRAWEWSLSKNQITSEFKANWAVNPGLAKKKHGFWEINKLLTAILTDHEYLGFIDGSWKATAQCYKIGICGFLMDKHRKVQFIFSGPLQTCIQG